MGIPIKQQRLVYGRKQLIDSMSLEDYKICENALLILALNNCGGGNMCGGDGGIPIRAPLKQDDDWMESDSPIKDLTE